MTQPSTRVQLYQSRFIHSAHADNDRTDCHIYGIALADPTWHPDSTPVTCRQCIGRMAEEARS